MKIPEAVLVELWRRLPGDCALTLDEVEPALGAALEQLRGELEGDGVRMDAGRAAYLDFDPTGDFDLLEEPLRMTWEGNTAAGMQAALNSVLGEAEHQGGGG